MERSLGDRERPLGAPSLTGVALARAGRIAIVLSGAGVASCAGHEAAPRDAREPAAAVESIDPVELGALVDSLFAAGMEEEGIPGAAFVLVEDGRVVLSKGFGMADVGSGRAVDPDRTIFPFASISKVFTATAIMQLAERGRVDLDADADRYLASVQVPPTYPQPITVENLLTHTSGLDELPGRRVEGGGEILPLARFLEGRLVRVHPPGEVTSYSSYGMALAGLLVEDVSGQPFESVLRDRIWRPLGMSRTSITVPDSLRADLATAYAREGDSVVAIPHERYQTPPASSIVGTAADMARFMIAHLEGGGSGEARILSAATVSDMHRQHATMHPLVPGWGLGFQLDDTNGRRIAEHGGDIGGFSALMTLLPDEGVGFFVVHHLEGENLRFDVRRAILDRYFSDRREPSPPRPDPGAAATLARYGGTYRGNLYCHTCPDGGPGVQDFEVEANGDGTIGLWGTRWVETGPLFFTSLDGRRHIGFAEDAAGRIVAVSGGAWRVLERIR